MFCLVVRVGGWCGWRGSHGECPIQAADSDERGADMTMGSLAGYFGVGDLPVQDMLFEQLDLLRVQCDLCYVLRFTLF